MRSRWTTAVVWAVLASALSLGACDIFITSKVQFYQKLTITLDVDGREVVGSSVMTAGMQHSRGSLGGAGGSGRWVRGEAVTLDLGNGHYLFALLEDPRGTPETHYDSKFIAGSDIQSVVLDTMEIVLTSHSCPSAQRCRQ